MTKFELDRVVLLIDWIRYSLLGEIEKKNEEIDDCTITEKLNNKIRCTGWLECANQMLEKLDTLIELIENDASVNEVEE